MNTYLVSFIDEGNCDIDYIEVEAPSDVDAIEMAYAELIDSVEPDEVAKVTVEIIR